MTWRIAIRTRYFDDVIKSFLDDAMEHASPVQVVHLGAGMDSRPFRLNAARSTVFYELDNTDVLVLKEKLLCNAIATESPEIRDIITKGNDRRISLGCNIELGRGTDWKAPLLKAGFDWTKPTCWVLEGLTYYIRDDATMRGIFTTMRRLSAPKSRLIVSVASRASLLRAGASNSSLMQSWKWASDQPDLVLRECGWDSQSVDVVALGEQRANYGRFQQSEAFRQDNGRTSGIMYVTGRC
eukprot:gnl/TRDRNA2_/TRDRNA2_49840_c0_seq1.p1 gnl/TRDRNA2_/TRDRNA2_49840_c0~~gnl/TRDRNA2_/TRDRNA2_49840_c0_seq1.p1  ORF type:complete len:240 (-),score=22.90 gnl/TRDRNA2_/TRDRNA2_49840_c0_seq1:500-1219(-)